MHMTVNQLAILHEHQGAVLGELAKAKSDKVGPANFEQQLRERMTAELRSHAQRTGREHKYFWERIATHATPHDLAKLIDRARQRQPDNAESKAINGRLEAVEDHLLGRGDGRFGDGSEPAVDQAGDGEPAADPAAIASLVRAFGGRMLGVEAGHPELDEHAISGPDPQQPGGARVTRFNQHGVIGHSTHESPAAAVAHMAASGYTEPAHGKYDEVADSPHFDWHHESIRAASRANAHRARGDHAAASQVEAAHYGRRPHPAAAAGQPRDHGQDVAAAVDEVVGA